MTGEHGFEITLSERVSRVLARNPGPFTHTGTATHIIGREAVAILDPGPDDEAHIAAILAAVGSRPVSHIVVTHTHRDHTGGVDRLRRAIPAPVVGAGPHIAARALGIGESNALELSADRAYRPDLQLAAGDRIEGTDFTLECVPTPGHTANHLSFALVEEAALFCGDHVMDWSTSIVAPPDGSMGDYLHSLDLLLDRRERLYYPAHGLPIPDGPARVRALRAHRHERETAILSAIRAGASDLDQVVDAVYLGLDPRLRNAAGLSALAQIEHLAERGFVTFAGTGTAIVVRAA